MVKKYGLHQIPVKMGTLRKLLQASGDGNAKAIETFANALAHTEGFRITAT